MGSCISPENINSKSNNLPQEEIKDAQKENSDTSTKQSTQISSPGLSRLEKIKAKLQPLEQGTEQRNRIIHKCHEIEQNIISNKLNRKDSKSLSNGTPKVLQVKIDKSLQITRSSLFQCAMASLATAQHLQEDFS